ALSAIDALLRATGALLPDDEGRLPGALQAGAMPVTEAEREAWRQLLPGAELLAEAGLRAADETAAQDFHERTRAAPALTIIGIESGNVAQFSAAIPIEARASVMLRSVAGQSATALAIEVERLMRSACPPAAVLELTWDLVVDGAATEPEAPQLAIASDAIEQCFGTRPVAVRCGGSLPLFETLSGRGIPVINTGFGIEREANMHGPNERFPERHLELGTDAVVQILTRLG